MYIYIYMYPHDCDKPNNKLTIPYYSIRVGFPMTGMMRLKKTQTWLVNGMVHWDEKSSMISH